MGGYMEIARDFRQKIEPPASGQETIVQALKKRGYIAIDSDIIDGTIYFCRDHEIALSLPDGSVAFTLRELTNLITQTYTPEELRQLVEAKRELLSQQKSRKLAEQAERLFNGVMVNIDTPANEAIFRLVMKRDGR